MVGQRITCVCDRLPEDKRPCFYHRSPRSAEESRAFVEAGIRRPTSQAEKKKDREEILEEERKKIQQRERAKRRGKK